MVQIFDKYGVLKRPAVLGVASWGSIIGVVTAQTDLITYLSSTYYPIPTGTTSEYIRGDGSIVAFPSIPSVTPSALTKVDDTNVTLTLGGTPATALLQSVSLTLGWTGTLADSRIASSTYWNNKVEANDVEKLLYSDVGSLGSHTGDTANTIVFNLNIPANTFISKDFFNKLFHFSKTGTDGCTARLYLGTTGTTADTLIATALSGSTQGWLIFRERSHFNGSDLFRINSTTNLQSDLVATNNASSSFTLTSNLILSVAFQLTNSADVATLIAYKVIRTRKI